MIALRGSFFVLGLRGWVIVRASMFFFDRVLPIVVRVTRSGFLEQRESSLWHSFV